MSLNIDHPNPREEVEQRIGIRPIEDAMQERDVLVERAAKLHGLHGSPMVWDAQRKAKLMTIRQAKRGVAMAAKGAVWTEARLDEAAHAAPEYLDFIAQTLEQRAELYRTEKALEAWEHRYYRDQATAKFAASEARLG